jgi:hypothetical protein
VNLLVGKKPSASWNLYSTFVNPLIVFAVSILLIVVKSENRSLLYLLPLAFLAANSLICAIFWAIRLSRCRRPWFPILLAVGYVARILGWFGFLALIALALSILLRQPWWRREFPLGTDWKFWIFWTWAFLEAIHHHFYKLTFGSHDTLQNIVEGRKWNRLREPLGGAIGIQLRKLRQR